MQPMWEDCVTGAVEDYNHMVTTEDYNMGAIESNILVVTEGDRSVRFYSLLI